MSNRTLRVSELIQREISAYLHTRYQSEAVRITVTGVVVSPDLHDGRVFYSVLGGKDEAAECGRWLREKTGEIRHIRRPVVRRFFKYDGILFHFSKFFLNSGNTF